jgi:hypothetical protein
MQSQREEYRQFILHILYRLFRQIRTMVLYNSVDFREVEFLENISQYQLQKIREAFDDHPEDSCSQNRINAIIPLRNNDKWHMKVPRVFVLKTLCKMLRQIKDLVTFKVVDFQEVELLEELLQYQLKNLSAPSVESLYKDSGYVAPEMIKVTDFGSNSNTPISCK